MFWAMPVSARADQRKQVNTQPGNTAEPSAEASASTQYGYGGGGGTLVLIHVPADTVSS